MRAAFFSHVPHSGRDFSLGFLPCKSVRSTPGSVYNHFVGKSEQLIRDGDARLRLEAWGLEARGLGTESTRTDMHRDNLLRKESARPRLLCAVLFSCFTLSALSLHAQEQEEGPSSLPGSLTGGLLVNRIDATPLTVNAVQTPISGFIPWVGMTLTDEFEDSTLGNVLFFQAELSAAPGGTKLSAGGSPHYEVALLDSGAQVDLLSYQATQNFDVVGNGFGGTNTIPIGGATGLIEGTIQDPLGVYAGGLQDATSYTPLTIPDGAMPGQTSISLISVPQSSTLPSVIGLPMISQYTTVIRSDQPLIVDVNSETVRTPSIEFKELGSGPAEAQALGITRRAPITFKPEGSGNPFLSPPFYAFTFVSIDQPLHDDPTAPSHMAGGMFLTVDMANDGNELTDKKLFFDTGAEVSVVSTLMAAQLGFDAVLDTPDFTIELEGSGGSVSQVPGFIADEFHIVTIGGDFTVYDVPLVVLDIPDPSDPANIVSGIVGTNVFADRNLVIDPVPTIFGPGTPNLYISDPVTTVHTWDTTAASGVWSTPTHWDAIATPGELWIADVAGVSGAAQEAVVSSNSTVHQLFVSGGAGQMTVVIEDAVTLTTFGHTTIQPGGGIHLEGGTLSAQAIILEGGVLSGSGTVIGDVNNEHGVISPGESAGILLVEGIFAQRGGSTLAIEIGGLESGDELTDPEFDNLVIDGPAVVDGLLEVSLIDDFEPLLGSSFDILTEADSVDGMFSAANFPLLGPGLVWDIDYGTNRITLEVVNALLGDMNGDGALTEDDIDSFVLALTNPAAYDAMFPLLQREALGDVNLDGLFNLGDVGDFKGLSFDPGSAAAQSIPEPGALGLLAVACFGLVLSRRRWHFAA